MSGPRPRHVLLTVLAAIVVAAVFAVLIWDWAWFKGPATRAASDALGREVSAAELDVDLGIKTRVVLNDVRIGNVAWGEAESFAEVDRIEALIRLPALIVGNVDITELILTRPDVSLERNAEGVANWSFKRSASEQGDAGQEEADSLPLLRRLEIVDGTVTYDDRQSDTRLDLKVATAQATPGIGDEKLSLTGKGDYRGQPFDLSLGAGSVYALMDGAATYPVDLRAQIGEHDIVVTGTLDRPLNFGGMDMNITAQGPNLAEIAEIAGIAEVPSKAPYAISGKVSRDDEKTWVLEDVKARLGDNRLSTNGTLTEPFVSGSFDIRLDLEGPDLATLAALGGVEIPETPAFSLNGRITRDDEKTWVLEDVEARLGDNRLSADGTLTEPFRLGPADLQIDLEGPNLATLAALGGVEMPKTPAFSLKGRVDHENKIWGLRDFTTRLGESVVTGQLRYESPEERAELERPLITGELASDTINYNDFAAFTEMGDKGEGRQKPETSVSDRVIPDLPLDRPELKAVDVDVRLRIATVADTAGKFDALDTHILLKSGRLALERVDLKAAGSSFTGSVSLDTSQMPATVKLDAEMDNFDLALVLPQRASDAVRGHLGGRVNISGSGDSVVPLLESLKGRVTAFLAGGRLNEFLAEVVGLDILGTLRSLMKDENVTTRVRCMVADFSVENGVLRSDALVLDTDSVVLIGNGTISLPRERLDITLTPRARGLNPLSFSTPLVVSGTFRNVSVGPQATGLGLQAGKTLALGLFLGPLSALVPMVENKLAGDGNCGALLNEAKQPAPEEMPSGQPPPEGAAPSAPAQ